MERTRSAHVSYAFARLYGVHVRLRSLDPLCKFSVLPSTRARDAHVIDSIAGRVRCSHELLVYIVQDSSLPDVIISTKCGMHIMHDKRMIPASCMIERRIKILAEVIFSKCNAKLERGPRLADRTNWLKTIDHVCHEAYMAYLATASLRKVTIMHV